MGKLDTASVYPVAPDSITAADARRAWYETHAALLDDLRRREEGKVYRIELGHLHPDPRIALRDLPASREKIKELRKQLKRFDSQPWTLAILEVLSSNPGVRAGNLCVLVGQEKAQFKRNVRKLKNLGLT